MEKKIEQRFSVSFSYPVHFTEGLFEQDNPLLADLAGTPGKKPSDILFVLDRGVCDHQPDLQERIEAYAEAYRNKIRIAGSWVQFPGGETAKNDPGLIRSLLTAIDEANLDRHSFIAVIGGGAVIDAAGYAAAIAHRGIRLIRIPTTVLAQNDAAIGVKNGINEFGKKNFLGTFVPPFAVLNDFQFLSTLDDRDWRSGISEAVKVALIRDGEFFNRLEEIAPRLANREPEAMKELIIRCAELHLDHIAGSGDPFESGSSRPLDFGHWSAHKLEQMTRYRLRHGEAVAIGIALDATYSSLEGRLGEAECLRILNVLKVCGFTLFVPELEEKLDEPDQKDSILYGLEEFREHLGGELTIMLLDRIGTGTEVHEVDYELYKKAIFSLQQYESVSHVEPERTR
ncbi:MAG: 3-dehydroquinate synthase [Balneolaceae bacterium]